MKQQLHNESINKQITKIFLVASNRVTDPKWLNKKKIYKFTQMEKFRVFHLQKLCLG